MHHMLCALSLSSMLIPTAQSQSQSSDVKVPTCYRMLDNNIMGSPDRFPTAHLPKCVPFSQIEYTRPYINVNAHGIAHDSYCDWNEQLIAIAWDSHSWVTMVSKQHAICLGSICSKHIVEFPLLHYSLISYTNACTYPIDSGFTTEHCTRVSQYMGLLMNAFHSTTVFSPSRLQIAEQSDSSAMPNHFHYGYQKGTTILHGIEDVFLNVLSSVWLALHGPNTMMYILLALINNAKGQTYFRTNTTTNDWFTAREHCQSEGGDLAIISTEAEQVAVASFLGSDSYLRWFPYFVGTFQISIDGVGTNAISHMYHIDGTEMNDSFVHWINPTIKEYFATDVILTTDQRIHWRHTLIDDHFRGLCESGLDSYNYPMIWNQLLPGMSASSTALGATKFNSQYGSYFLLDYAREEATTVHAANQYCLARGGLGLAYISTSALNTEAVNLCMQQTESSMGCWIGLSTWNDAWHWVDGTSTATLPPSISDRPNPLTIYLDQMSYHVYPPTSRWIPADDVENRVGICQYPPPTSDPTKTPTSNPTKTPTSPPTKTISDPTNTPTSDPTKTTSNPSYPTKTPTSPPTKAPTSIPTSIPTSSPTRGPTENPVTKAPSKQPTVFPTIMPTTRTTEPTKAPTMIPSIAPTAHKTTPYPTQPVYESGNYQLIFNNISHDEFYVLNNSIITMEKIIKKSYEVSNITVNVTIVDLILVNSITTVDVEIRYIRIYFEQVKIRTESHNFTKVLSENLQQDLNITIPPETIGTTPVIRTSEPNLISLLVNYAGALVVATAAINIFTTLLAGISFAFNKCKLKTDSANPMVLVVLGLRLTDMITDINLAYILWLDYNSNQRDDDILFILCVSSITFCALPWLINVLLICKVQRYLMKNKRSRFWFTIPSNTKCFIFLVLFTGDVFFATQVISSNIFGIKRFDAGISSKVDIERLRIMKVLGIVVFENIPQTIIGTIYALMVNTDDGSVQMVTFLSIAISAMSAFVVIMNWFLISCGATRHHIDYRINVKWNGIIDDKKLKMLSKRMQFKKDMRKRLYKVIGGEEGKDAFEVVYLSMDGDNGIYIYVVQAHSDEYSEIRGLIKGKRDALKRMFESDYYGLSDENEIEVEFKFNDETTNVDSDPEGEALAVQKNTQTHLELA
eukprot:858868_1